MTARVRQIKRELVDPVERVDWEARLAAPARRPLPGETAYADEAPVGAAA
jgi:hypothetical protein